MFYQGWGAQVFAHQGLMPSLIKKPGAWSTRLFDRALENQLEQSNDHDQTNQENDADGATQKLEHFVSP
ncbi:hypothetical protein [Pseudomonas sp. Irchel 3A18]|uniref:hypothetical protein n=1 Tax=Pseudomonas sp. Irchel 3A18 TaxID=2008905 RepID=UPI001179BA11|nr:hypothetical protein [Pseudomonas sp. Irchel 3A18]